MKRSLFFLFLVLFFTPLFSSDREIALVYQKKVWEFISHDTLKAWELLEVASSYHENLSGLWFARGELLEEDGNLYDAAESYYKAMAYDDWEGADYDSFLDRYFKLLARLGEWNRILEIRESIGFYRVNNSQVLLSSAWADYFLGHEREGAAKASRGINLYPENPDFYTLLLACSGDRKIIDGFLFYWGHDNDVLFKTIYTLYKLNKLPDQLKEYYILESHDDLAVFLSLKKTVKEEEKHHSSLKDYLNYQKLYDLDLLLELYDLTNEEGKKIIEKSLLEFRGEYYTDSNGDFYKEIVLNPNRNLSIDRNRDGRYETSIDLTQEGLPEYWFSELSGGNLRKISFFNWPHIKEIERQTSHGVQTFHFLFSRFNLEEENLVSHLYIDLDLSLMSIIKAVKTDDLIIPWEILLKNCYNLQEYKNGTLYRNYLFHGGDILGIEEDSLSDGYLDRQILMEKGEILASRIDLDRDGKYDLFEYYERGIWKGYAVNLNGKGWSDFYHDWSIFPVKIWDFENDHIINSYTLQSPEGEYRIIEPQLSDVINVDDLLYWEKKFEKQWYP